MLAATVRVTRDLDAAEEAVQDAYLQALEHWAREGVPARPGAWLTTVARRRALNVVSRARTLDRKLPLLLAPEEEELEEDHLIPDDRLRLIFTCCHPALARPAQLALTLRLVCGVATADVAHAFLVPEPTMAARITRAKKKIAAARIPYVVPGADELPARLDAVLTVIYLLHATGHTAPAGDDLVREELTARALDLARMLHVLLPGGEAAGLLALLLCHEARRGTRTDGDGRLLRLWPSAVVALNRAVALAMVHGSAAALAALEPLERELAGYRYLHATKADRLHRLGRDAEAVDAYEAALALTDNAKERTFLEQRLA